LIYNAFDPYKERKDYLGAYYYKWNLYYCARFYRCTLKLSELCTVLKWNIHTPAYLEARALVDESDALVDYDPVTDAIMPSFNQSYAIDSEARLANLLKCGFYTFTGLKIAMKAHLGHYGKIDNFNLDSDYSLPLSTAFSPECIKSYPAPMTVHAQGLNVINQRGEEADHSDIVVDALKKRVFAVMIGRAVYGTNAALPSILNSYVPPLNPRSLKAASRKARQHAADDRIMKDNTFNMAYNNMTNVKDEIRDVWYGRLAKKKKAQEDSPFNEDDELDLENEDEEKIIED